MMKIFDELTNKNFKLYAANNYNNPECTDVEEFKQDLSRFKYLKRLFRKYEVTKEIKIRLVLNHLVVLQNVFGAEVAITLLLYKVDNKYWSILKTCLNYLDYLYPHELDKVNTDKNIEEMLKEL